MNIGIIGCGNMGAGMAVQLLRSGRVVSCFDPDSRASGHMQDAGAQITHSVSDLAKTVKLIILSLPNATIVESVMQEMLSGIQAGTIILDASTSEPATSQAMSALGDKHDFAFIDGPVSGGPAAAHAGTMTMLLGGSRQAIESIAPILDIITAKRVIVGQSGAGHAAKIANNMLCAANLVLVADAVKLGKAAGVQAKDLLEGINAGSGRSGVSEVNFPKWILSDAFDSGFTMGLMRKDVKLALDLANRTDVELSGFNQIAEQWLSQTKHIPDSADFNEIARDIEKV